MSHIQIIPSYIPMPTATVITAVIPFVLLSILSIGIYRVYFHPLSKFPGPTLWAITQIPQAYYLARGRLPYKILQLHDKYGPIVRMGPDEISFITADAWNDIYSKPSNRPELPKYHTFVQPSTGVNGLIFEIDDKEHNRLRRSFSYAFSDKSLREQAPVVIQHTDKLIAKLHENTKEPIDICDWLNYTFFDITGEILFSDSFDALHDSTLHPWIKVLYDWVAGAALLSMANRFWPVSNIISRIVPKAMRDAESYHRFLTKERLDKRLANSKPRLDLVSNVQKCLNDDSLTYTELLETVRVIMVGGSETTATLFSGILYYLLETPHALSKLTTEVRSTFDNASEINMYTVQKLEYQLAAINEALRMFPPLPGNLRRITPPEGCIISKHFVPGNTIVGVDMYAAHYSVDNFSDPKSFHPERWLADIPSEFQNDNRKVFQPFSIGPRNCIAKNVVYMEMSLVLAKLIFEFDLKIAAESKLWLEGVKVFGFISKPKLFVHLVPADRE